MSVELVWPVSGHTHTHALKVFSPQKINPNKNFLSNYESIMLVFNDCLLVYSPLKKMSRWTALNADTCAGTFTSLSSFLLDYKIWHNSVSHRGQHNVFYIVEPHNIYSWGMDTAIAKITKFYSIVSFEAV